MGGVVARYMAHAVTANGRALNQLLTVPASSAGSYSIEARPSRTEAKTETEKRMISYDDNDLFIFYIENNISSLFIQSFPFP